MVSRLLGRAGMSRLAAALLALTAVSCADREGPVRATNRSTGAIQTFSSTKQVPEGWDLCPPGSECPEPLMCGEIGEADCLIRTDCEPVYLGTNSGTKVFAECRPKSPPVDTCAIEGESCTKAGCCEGLECCAGVPVPAGAEYCSAGSCPISDRNLKHDIVPVDADEVLAKLARMPVATWTYDFEAGVKHMGPMAQDFAATFGLGNTDRRIFSADADGVALASIQALLRRVETLQGANRELNAENDDLRRRLLALEKRTTRLEATAR